MVNDTVTFARVCWKAAPGPVTPPGGSIPGGNPAPRRHLGVWIGRVKMVQGQVNAINYHLVSFLHSNMQRVLGIPTRVRDATASAVPLCGFERLSAPRWDSERDQRSNHRERKSHFMVKSTVWFERRLVKRVPDVSGCLRRIQTSSTESAGHTFTLGFPRWLHLSHRRWFHSDRIMMY